MRHTLTTLLISASALLLLPQLGFAQDAEPESTTPVVTVPQGVPNPSSTYGTMVRKVIKRSTNQVRACYERGLMVNPDLAGRVDVAFTIDATGSVSEVATTSDTLEAPEVTTCIEETIRGLAFPAPENGIVKVSYPFTFATEAPPAEDSAEEPPTDSEEPPKEKKKTVFATGMNVVEDDPVMDPQLVKRIVSRHKAEVRWCYDAALKQNPGIQGRIELELVLEADGQFSESKIAQDTAESDALSTCLLKKAQGWKFPPPSEKTIVRLPFDFE